MSLRLTRANVRRVARDVRREVLRVFCGEPLTDACYYASTALLRALADADITAALVVGRFRRARRSLWPHYWVVVERRRLILDVTATQFGRFPRVWYPADPKYYIETPSFAVAAAWAGRT